MTIKQTSFAVIVTSSLVLAGCVGRDLVKNSDIPGLKKLLAQPNHGGANLHGLVNAAAELDCADCIPVLVQAGADLNPKDLEWAVAKGSKKVARSMIEAGVDPDAAIFVFQRDTGLYQSDIANGIAVLMQLKKERRPLPVETAHSDDASGRVDKEAASPTPAQPASSGAAAPWWAKTDGK